MAVTINIYNQAKKYLLDGTLDLDTTGLKVTLHTGEYVPTLDDEVFATATCELGTEFGYTQNDMVLSNALLTQVGGVVTFTADPTTWMADGGSIGPCHYAVIHGDGLLNSRQDPLLLYIDFGVDVTATDTNPLTLQWNASGILTLV